MCEQKEVEVVSMLKAGAGQGIRHHVPRVYRY